MKEMSVSLLLMTRRSLKPDEPEELEAVLQLRGEENHETDQPESWCGACQLTVHGKMLPDETYLQALWRETAEELGEDFAGWVKTSWQFEQKKVVEIGRVEKPNKTIVHYCLEVPAGTLRTIRFNASTGGQRRIRQSDLANIQSLMQPCFNKVDGVDSRKVTAMFPDEIDALKQAFEIFGKQQPDTEVGFNGDELHRLECMHRLATES